MFRVSNAQARFFPKRRTSHQAAQFESNMAEYTYKNAKYHPIAKVTADRAILNNEIHHRNSPAEITRAARIYEIPLVIKANFIVSGLSPLTVRRTF